MGVISSEDTHFKSVDYIPQFSLIYSRPLDEEWDVPYLRGSAADCTSLLGSHHGSITYWLQGLDVDKLLTISVPQQLPWLVGTKIHLTSSVYKDVVWSASLVPGAYV